MSAGTRVHVDRTEQLRLVRELIERDDRSSAIVLLQAEELMGKSAFLVEVSEHLHGRATITLVDLDSQATVEDLLDDLASALQHQGVDMARYVNRSEEFATTSGSIVLQRSSLRRSQLTLVTSSKEHAEQRQRTLLREFVAALESHRGRRNLLLFDSYEHVRDELGHWFRGRFLPELLRIPGTIAVLAGRSVPQLHAGIRPISLGLAPFSAEHIVEWLVRMDATYSSSEMRLIAHLLCVEHAGRPGMIDGIIQALKSRGWRP